MGLEMAALSDILSRSLHHQFSGYKSTQFPLVWWYRPRIAALREWGEVVLRQEDLKCYRLACITQ